MTEQQPSLPDNYNDWCWYRQGKKQNDDQQYEQAISCFECAIQQDLTAHDAWHCKSNFSFLEV